MKINPLINPCPHCTVAEAADRLYQMYINGDLHPDFEEEASQFMTLAFAKIGVQAAHDTAECEHEDD